ncbi:MAG: 3-dehydroquinate dehydratase [Actinobacteria bacterium]|jgi:3-dehydroquinate dehydratase-2|nr:3-dehydroquinate dehydratase [Actinomycetota bacterium]
MNEVSAGARDVRNGSKRLVVLHGPNLDLLGERPPEHYGDLTLPALERMVTDEVERVGWECLCLQTNHEGTFIECVHEYRHEGALLVNAGAWTHYSYAIHDALELVDCPIAEVHLSDVFKRESWRRRSVISDVVDFVVGGKGPEGYLEAVRLLISLADRR